MFFHKDKVIKELNLHLENSKKDNKIKNEEFQSELDEKKKKIILLNKNLKN